MKKYVFESLKFLCAAILCTILSAFATPSWGANCNLLNPDTITSTTVTIPVEYGKTYVWSYDKTNYDFRWDSRAVYGVDSNNEPVDGGVALSPGGNAYNTTSYFVIRIINPSVVAVQTIFRAASIQPTIESIKNSKMMFEEGTTATAYTPYNPLCATCDGTIVNYTSATGTGVQNGTPTPENPIEPTFYKQGNMILRAVGNYKDSYDATTGKITRRVGVKVFDGTENWSRDGNTTWFYNSSIKAGAQTGISSHGKVNKSASGEFGFSGSGFVEINTEKIGIETTNNAIQQYLAQQYANGTPVTIYYPLAEETTEDWPASYCETPIKIATTKYNETKFSPLNTALQNAISVVDSVVSNTITQAASIATLQTQKQTRPADDTCPAYKQCLLVEDENGTPHWYEITDPFRDFVAPIIAQGISPTDTVAVFDAGYTQLEYIESTGTQWIDTGVVGNMGIAAEIKLSISNARTSWILGSRTGPDKRFGAIILTEARWDFGLNADNSFGQYVAERDYVINFVTNLNTPSTMSINDGNSIAVSEVNNTDLQLYLFNVNYNGTPTSGQGFIGKIYYSKIWNNNTLVRNMIPVRNNATGKYGMYDTVGQRFYGNAASSGDDFTAGSVVANDADVPVPQWIRAWDANAQYNLSAGEVYGTAQCNNLSGTEHAQKATSAQMASSGWSENGAKCWCKVVGINVDNEYTEAPATASWVFDAVRSSVEDCNKMCAAACSNRVFGEAAFRKALFGD